jgi:hypothetical protein
MEYTVGRTIKTKSEIDTHCKCCKTAISKRNTYSRKGRVCLDTCLDCKAPRKYCKVIYQDSIQHKQSVKNGEKITTMLKNKRLHKQGKNNPKYIERKKKDHLRWISKPENFKKAGLSSMKSQLRQRINLENGYLRHCIISYDKFPRSDINKELIDLKRKQLILYRNVKKQKQKSCNK